MKKQVDDIGKINKEQVTKMFWCFLIMLLVCYKQDVALQKLKKDVDQINKNSDQMKLTLSTILAKLMNPHVKVSGGFSKPSMTTDSQLLCNQRTCSQEHKGDQQIVQLPRNQGAPNQGET